MHAPQERSTYLQVLQAALAARQYRYARQAALDWLATYPGDLAVSLAYARALQGENHLEQAAVVLHGLCQADPEDIEAVDVLLAVERQAGGDGAGPQALRFALTGRLAYQPGGYADVPAWSDAIWKTRQALSQQGCSPAEAGHLFELATQAGDQPLLAVTHLRLLEGQGLRGPSSLEPHPQDVRLLALRLETAQGYARRWPNCLAVSLLLAEWCLQAGQHAEAVALLHQAASRDVGGQVAQRLWGAQHPYRSLWPERLEHRLPGSPPAAVAAVLGWNRLEAFTLPAGPGTAGSPEQEMAEVTGENPAVDETSAQGYQSPALAADTPGPLSDPLSWRAEAALPDAAATRPSALLRRIWSPAMPQTAATPAAVEDPSQHKTDGVGIPAPQPAGSVKNAPTKPAPQPGPGAAPPVLRPGQGNPAACSGKGKGADPELLAVAMALDDEARRQRLPGVSHLDGRYPVYVIFSLHQRLVDTYGAQAAALLESEMAELAETVDQLPRWGAQVVLADDPVNLQPYALAPVRSGDPWVLKHFLADLDAAMARRGERIGALLIAGGPEIVPFHHLPNPVDDQDVDVPSDNPYATRDENYFVPEWPVGRLPGGAGQDAHLLLAQLQNIRRSHLHPRRSPSWPARAWSWLRCRVDGAACRPPGRQITGRGRISRGLISHRLISRHHAPFGYTAAVWRRAAAQVFSPTGRGRRLHVSPPFGLDGSPDSALNGLTQPEPSGLTGGVPQLYGQLGYFNLHGLVDAPDWYGQRDPLDPSDAPDYPVALRPQDIDLPEAGQPTAVPRVVFSEACYGLHIQDRTPEQAIALRFLQAGALAVAGCTVMAYGAIAAPLVAADLLGQAFWRLLQEGLPAGEALRQAKIRLATEMSEKQGFLDGEDQKTLISFTLYGDPLAQVNGTPLQARSVRYSVRYQDQVLADLRTVCDRSLPAESDPSPPPEVLAGVRRTVARYLPGMSDARVTFAHARERCTGEGHTCPTSQMEHPLQAGTRLGSQPCGLPRPNIPARRRAKGGSHASSLPGLVTLSKQVSRADGVHPRIARLTLDERGQLVKLVVSR